MSLSGGGWIRTTPLWTGGGVETAAADAAWADVDVDVDVTVTADFFGDLMDMTISLSLETRGRFRAATIAVDHNPHYVKVARSRFGDRASFFFLFSFAPE
jgi:hypothetical protein